MSECRWQKSSYSVEGSNCLYVAAGESDTIMLRESEYPEVILSTTRTHLRTFIRAAKAGQFDHIGEPGR
ncbi:hypothetical protein GCM10017744_037380 [Streptomyces antimycoticus]|uniref:DUF397 domain-containing protein n=1 Tax=Streptomyces antimycoticus TaxID=68175 RepID=A0A4D4K920_9ACTN|nr:DUF397 domain-containing protein [Streptomyces antimycoticus]GDY45641.1 hypothetical protein SANT12839_065230 [Streptomyces antimycoticus]